MARLLGMTRRGNGLRLTAAAVVAMAALWGISTASAAETRGAAPSAKGAEKTYRFVVSNNFLGNDWRPQVERLAQLTTNYPPFKGRVKVEIQNADNTVQAQIQSLNNIIQTKPDAILLIASSGTALNPTVARACAAKILVFTISSVITAPCAWNVSQSMFDGQKVVGRWMGKVLKNQGSIFVDRGITGLKDAQDIQDGFMAGLKETGSKVEVAGQFDGKFAAGPEQSGISSLLVANPDVSGVMTQGYCQPVFNALKAGGKGSVPATCYAYNGELTACAKSGRACAILSGSPNRDPDRHEGCPRRARREAGPAEDQAHPGADDRVRHQVPRGQGRGLGRQGRGHEGGEELLPGPPARPRAAVDAPAVPDLGEGCRGEVTAERAGAGMSPIRRRLALGAASPDAAPRSLLDRLRR